MPQQIKWLSATHSISLNGLIIALTLLILVGILAIFEYQPPFGDDFINTRTVQRLGTLPNYVSHMYSTWMGRIPQSVLLWLAFYGGWSRFLFQALSFLTLLGTFILAAAIPLGRLPHIFGRDRIYFLLLCSALWFGNPVISETVFWTTGATAYLFSGFFLLAFLMPYVWAILPKSDLKRCLTTPLRKTTCSLIMLLLGFCAGSCHEQVTSAVLFFLFIWGGIAWRVRKLEPIHSVLLSGIFGFILGAITLSMSPGSLVRLDLEYRQVDTFYKLARGLASLAHNLLNPQIAGWLAAIFLCSHLISFGKSGADPLRDRRPVLILLSIAGIASLFPIFYMNYFTGRTTYFALLCFVMGCGAGLIQYNGDRWQLAPGLSYICFFILLTIATEVARSAYQTHRLTTFIQHRDQSIIQQTSAGQQRITVNRLPSINDRLIYILDTIALAHDDPLIESAAVGDNAPIYHSLSWLIERTWRYPYGYQPTDLVSKILLQAYGLKEGREAPQHYYQLANQAISELYGVKEITISPKLTAP